MPNNSDGVYTHLRHTITQEAESLRSTIRVYAWRSGLAEGHQLNAVAEELLQDVVVEALRHADRLDPERSIKAWLLGIAANLIRRRQVEHARREQREPLVRDLFPHRQEQEAEDTLFEKVADFYDPQDNTNAHVDELLQLVPPADRDVLHLAIIHEMNGEALGRALGISSGAARVRLHRALGRLRTAYTEWQSKELDS